MPRSAAQLRTSGQVPVDDLDAGLQRWGARRGRSVPVPHLSPVEQSRGRVPVVIGGADICHDEVPAMLVLGGGGIPWSIGLTEVSVSKYSVTPSRTSPSTAPSSTRPLPP